MTKRIRRMACATRPVRCRLALWLTVLLAAGTRGVAQPESTPVHDPVMIKQGDTYYLFGTGRGISVWSSPDRNRWQRENPVFAQPPAWAVAAVPGFKDHLWAPDISLYNGQYYLFYSVSAFGKNTSCIGLATNKTLNPRDPAYRWEDQGMIVQSVPGRDLWNAIDPNLAFDEDGKPWLAFGSFWNGLKLVKLKDDLTALADAPPEWRTVASRPRAFGTADTSAGGAAIEAPFIFRKGKYYYLFASFDYCCRGANSTYKIVVGRSERLTGPYRDKTGKAMQEGGGSLVLAGNGAWHGVGHNAAYTFDGTDYLVFHGYDATDHGKSKLRIEKLGWDAGGWPVVALPE